MASRMAFGAGAAGVRAPMVIVAVAFGRTWMGETEDTDQEGVFIQVNNYNYAISKHT